MRALVVCVCALVLGACAARQYPVRAQSSMGWDNDYTLHHKLWMERHAPGMLRDPVGPPPRFFTQDQDHFDGSNSNTWQQAYYVNDTFFVPGSDAPVFLCVGGEGPALDGTAVVSSVHCNDAVEFLQETGALMFALEHRYYGCHNMSACPVSSFLPSNSLRFLSSRQALADIVGFVKYATAAYNLPANKWVTFGGR
jgi:serine protease 16